MGQMKCDYNAKLVCVQLNQKTVETCNGWDDDCNGKIDDNIAPRECTNACGYKGNEYCDMGTWSPCDAQACCTGEGGPCDTGLLGICRDGKVKCDASQHQTCEQLNKALDHELCNGLDDNCNGEVDEGNPGGGEPCMTGQRGECAQGHSQCNDGIYTCLPDRLPVAEECDGLDNDCDGIIDNGVTNQCGTCGDLKNACPKDGVDPCNGYSICG
jgi:hypothetical protein